MENLNKYIEHTLLKPEASKADLKKICQEAVDNKFLGVCVNPINVAYAKQCLKNSAVKVVTVVGFPLGATFSEIKASEAKFAIEKGADEVDMVINIGAVKDKDYDFVENDIKTVKSACGNKNLKVIIETDLLSDDEIKRVSEIVANSGSNFIKTSTGFVKNGVGAQEKHVKIMHDIVSSKGLEVKASGGVRTKEAAINMVKAGATRIGTSSGITIVSK